MQVKLKVSRAGVEDGITFAQRQGDIIDLPNDEAKRLLEDGQAEPVAEKRAKKAETRDKKVGN